MGKRKWWKKKHTHKQQQQAKDTKVIAASPTDKRIAAYTKPCHEDVVAVFTHENVTFWGGRAKSVMMYDDWDLMVLFSDRDTGWETNEPQTFINSNSTARDKLDPSLFLITRHAPWIGLDWPDFYKPTMTEDWWWTLIDNILGWDTAGAEKNVAFGCTGGHGRTGTALSVMKGLLQDVNDDSDPVAFVRQKYCDKAVESRVQAEYVEEITGIPIFSKPSWTPTPQRGGSGYNAAYSHGFQGSAAGEYVHGVNLATAADCAAADAYAREKEELDATTDKRMLQRIVDAQIREELGLAPSDPLEAHTSDGQLYRAVTNAAGDIIRWEERKKDVAI